MTTIHTPMRDWITVALGVAAGLAATVGVTRFQLDWNDKFFTSNVLIYDVPQICVLITLLPLRPLLYP